MKRTLSLFFALLLCLVLVPLRETRADTTIDNISCGITKPRHKDRPNYIPYIWVGSHCHSADFNNKYFKNDIIWSGPNGSIEVEGEETFVYGEEYSVTIYVTADDGYIFADSPTVTLNGESVEFVKISDTYVRLYGHFVAEPIYLFSDPSIMINYPSVGQKPDYQPTPMYNSYSFGTSHSTGYNANYYKNDVCWKDLTDNTYFSPDGNKTFVAGHQYRVSYYLTPDFGYKFSSEYYPEIYSVAVDPEDEFGEHEHHYTTYELQSDGSGRCEYTFAALPEAKSGWQKIDGKWYYYENGNLVTGWKKVSGKWYWFDSTGVMKTGWQKISSKWYYFQSSGAMVTGWQTIGGKSYYFQSSGAMVTGVQQIGGKWYYFESTGAQYKTAGWKQISSKWYYFDSAGVAQTGWKLISGKWYYFASSGVMQTGWQTISGKTYYLGTSGVMVTGLQQIGGKWYYFESSGVQYKTAGWKQISSKWYYFDSTGVAKVGWLKENGKWYYFNASAQMVTGWQKISNKWYWFGTGGVMFANGDKTLDGKTYHFDASGVCTNP